MLNNDKGFTMIEIMAVFVILGRVMAITIPTIIYFLKGNSKDYYSKLEKTVESSSQEYFNDYKVNLPKEIGYVKRVDMSLLQSQKYITDILGIDKKTCSGDVVTQKRANGNYSYTACLKCERKKDGTYGYVSDNTECGYSEDNNGKITILIDGLGNKDSIRVPQGENYTIPNAKAYINGQPLTTIKPMPLSVDTNILTTYKIYYNYRSVIKELKIIVYDPKEPVLSDIKATVNDEVYTSNQVARGIVNITFSASDWTKTNVYGSGCDYFEYQINNQEYQKVNALSIDNINYFVNIEVNKTGNYNLRVRCVDKEGNVSNSKTFVVKVDMETPTAPLIVGGSEEWTAGSRVIKVVKEAFSGVGIRNYQYYISTSKTNQAGGSWENLQIGIIEKNITTQGVRYIFFRAVSKSGKYGDISKPEITKIDNNKPTKPILIGSSSNWYNTDRTISIKKKSTATSGIKTYQYLLNYYDKNNVYNTGDWENFSGDNTVMTFNTDGKYFISIRAISNSGLYSETSSIATCNIDKTGPVINGISGINGSFVSSSSKVSVIASDSLSGLTTYAYSFDNGSSWSNFNYKYFSSSTNFKIAVKDMAGNITYSDNYNINVDKNRPVMSYTTPDVWSNTTSTVTVTASDNESGLLKVEWALPVNNSCYSSDIVWHQFNGTFTTSERKNCIKATDRAGNANTMYAYAKIDKDPPYTPVIDIASTKNERNVYDVVCSANTDYTYSNNECTITHSRSSGATYWFYSDDKGESSAIYKEFQEWYNGNVFINWKRYDMSYWYKSPGISKWPSVCNTIGKCYTYFRTIDAAGNVGPGYLKINWIHR